MKRERDNAKGNWLQVVIIVVTVVLAVFLGSMSTNERLDRLHARIDFSNREMGEVKTELKMRFESLKNRLADLLEPAK